MLQMILKITKNVKRLIKNIMQYSLRKPHSLYGTDQRLLKNSKSAKVSSKAIFSCTENIRAEEIMKLYTIKSVQGETSYCSILQETDAGYILRICIDKEGYQKVSEDFIEKELFDLCVRTGYINEAAEAISGVA